MFYSYLVIAFRNLWKHRLFSFINVVGLASGMMVCLLALIDIKGAFDYGNFHPHSDRTYRVLTDVTSSDNQMVAFASTPMPLADVLKREYGFVEQTTQVIRDYAELTVDGKKLVDTYCAVDPAFFTVLGYKLASGQPAIAPRTAVLTPQTAEKFFGLSNPIGKVIHHQELGAITVTGVFQPLPTRSHLEFGLVVSMSTRSTENQKREQTDWKQYKAGYTYVRLKEGASVEALEKALPTITARNTKGIQWKTEKSYTFRPQSLATLSPAFEELQMSTWEPTWGKLATEMAVGLITLLLAVFNYVNLTLARSLSRAREVGIRKVSGAVRWQLMSQFMAESVILSVFALGVAYLLLRLIEPMPFVQQWLIGGVELNPTLWAVFVGFSIVTGLLAGFVPAHVLSGFRPAQVLRSQTGLKVFKGITLRKSLIVAQFTIALIAMIALLSVARQQNYMATADYGFRSEGILNIPLNTVPYQRLANELNRIPGVERVSATSELFGSHGGEYRKVRRQKTGGDSTAVFITAVDQHFIANMDLTLLAGQNSPEMTTDTAGEGSPGRFVLVNEEAVKAFRMGNPREMVGQTLWLNDSTEVQIAGVVKNFQFTTFSWAIKPLILSYQPKQFRYVNVRIADGAPEATLAKVQGVWKHLNPHQPFTGEWYRDFLYKRHSHEDDVNFMGLLTALAFSIACLGLLGMVTYTTETRVKEVGIRKVMGAEVRQIIWLLSWDFVKLLLIAGGIALPLGYLAGMAFLINFAYHVSIGFETLGGCIGLLLGLGGLTIGFRTYRAALSNPADSLRNE
ncbi:putative ABC transport system permease protein [Larkinella arboricola]|uniref:Putative ABC transport system permease protein n=1 Tax=Larkinella arboricola TaxID=643671 RepID=A0A327WSL8_LARAB|nr:ABC transporter permease [Larkinella arboricola]RAJ95443.1 putative ABC transport system permease protein [Larkinella arboricola]